MLKPFYQDDWVTIYNGDCLEILSQMERNSVDLIVTDPPYGQNWQSAQKVERHALLAGDATKDVGYSGVFSALGVLKGYRHAYIFGDFSFESLSSPVQIVWDKGNWTSGNLSLPWAKQCEYIQFGVKARAGRGKDGGVKYTDGALAARMRRGALLRYPRPSSVRHPTEKPLGLLRELIESSSRFNDIVLDPFVGVGSTCVAAKLEGRKSVGIEIDEKYCTIAAERCARVPDLWKERY